MRYEPAIDRGRLMEAVRDAYGIPTQGLAFVPVGFVAACYVVHGADGERRFLKLWPGLRVGQAAADRQHASLVLTRVLHDRGVGVSVPYPILTRRGALWADLSGTPFAIFPLLPGEAPPARLSPALQAELGRTLATIHRATAALADVLPVRDSHTIGFGTALRRGMEAAQRVGPGSRPGLRALRAWVRSHEDEIHTQLARLHALQEAVQRLDGPFVLCHRDLLGDNLLVDERGQLSALDWDEPAVAPPEHDLWVALGEDLSGVGFERVLDAYRRAGGAQPLHLDHFAFYLLRRFLGDMAARLDWLLKDDTAGHDDEELLSGMEVYGVARWAALDDTLATIAAALQ